MRSRARVVGVGEKPPRYGLAVGEGQASALDYRLCGVFSAVPRDLPHTRYGAGDKPPRYSVAVGEGSQQERFRNRRARVARLLCLVNRVESRTEALTLCSILRIGVVARCHGKMSQVANLRYRSSCRSIQTCRTLETNRAGLVHRKKGRGPA